MCGQNELDSRPIDAVVKPGNDAYDPVDTFADAISASVWPLRPVISSRSAAS